jgi:hypothetical protein
MVGPDLGGVRPFVRHHSDHEFQAGLAKMVDPSEPPPDNAVRLRHREGMVFDVSPPATTTSATSRGPAQVSTESYRRNYDTLFGVKQVVGQA